MVQLAPWSRSDWGLLERLNSPEMTVHVGGPESPERLEDRQRRYVAAGQLETAYVWKVMLLPEGVAIGNVSFWDRQWKGEAVYEIGWAVVPEYQGRGLASAAVSQAIELARATKRRPAVHAFPSIHNGPSNGICRKLGFALLGETDFEYPKGRWMRCNDWRLAL